MGERVEFASDGSSSSGYLAIPASGHGPGVVVIQEWWGLVPHIEELVDWFATQGFVALAPDLYGGVSTREPDEAGKLMMGLRIEQAAQDMQAAVDALLARHEVVGSTVGVTGFCMGGGLALLLGATSPQVRAVSAFYPAMPWADYQPEWSAYAGKVAAIHTSEGDGGSAAEPIREVAEAIGQAGGTVELFDYAGTQHAFVNDHRPEVFDAPSAQLALSRTVEEFRSALLS